ncbi:MAG: hypothetical protein LBS86_03300 [Treponema sp.]|jgi:hypothetical protein|nr:hypothetical protein [Treponema sp.]
MKKMLLLAAIGLALVTVMPVVAQENPGSPYYFVKVPVQKIYPNSRGYVVRYLKGVTTLVDAFLPIEWFEDDNRKEGDPPKGEVIFLTPGTAWPYLMVYYKDGAFSHVRLFVREDTRHSTWGSIVRDDLSDKFDGVEEIKLQF